MRLPLFPDLDLGQRPEPDGCAKPIGRRGNRAPRLVRVRKPASTVVMLTELRGILKNELSDVVMQLRKVERAINEQGQDLAGVRESVDGVLRHQLAIAREIGAVERPATPKLSRRRPLGT